MCVVWCALGATSRAHTFDEITLEELARASDVIALGRVVRADVLPYGPNALPGIHTRVELAVDEWLVTDGEAAPTVAFWVHGGRLGDRMRVVTGQARFVVGEEALVFLFRNEAGALWPAGMERGKWRIERGDAAGEPGGDPPLRLIGEPVPTASAPVVTGLGERLGLDELRARVATARRGS